uniref:Prenylcysteine oxidase 1 n=1 Tax=Callorhinchus milii TaxID=7868 RepID=V9KR20_CALMI
MGRVCDLKWFLLSAVCLSGRCSPGAPAPPPGNIAIIGAGIGGASAAYFMRQQFGKEVNIDVYESEKVGGRLATASLGGREYETGGSVIHSLNLHMKDFVKVLGLKEHSGQDELLAVYDGSQFVFEQSDWYIINFLKMVWYYGFNFLRVQMWVEGILDRFMRIYRYQSHGYSFTTVEKLLEALGGAEFAGMTNQSIDEALQKAGISQKFINEMVIPVMRVNYGQTVNINAFVGAVSLTGSDSDLWAVEGGNKRVCSGLLYSAKAHVITGKVTSVGFKNRPQRNGKVSMFYEVNYETELGTDYSMYDVVVIAVPLRSGKPNITFQDFSLPGKNLLGQYQQTVSTLIHGRLNTSYFGYPDPRYFRSTTILTMEYADGFFLSVSASNPVELPTQMPTQAHVWKVFSPEPLTKDQLGQLFTSYTTVHETKWSAYPRYSSRVAIPPIILHNHVYYLNAIEWAASAMEMSAISAKNIALLSFHRWYQRLDRINQDGLQQKLKSEL